MNPGELHRLAELNGIQVPTQAVPEVLTTVLAALGVPANTETEIRDSLRETRLRRLRRAIEPAVVAWERQPAPITIHLPIAIARKPMQLRLRLEDGSVQEFDPAPFGSEIADVEGECFISQKIILPTLPLGYHTLEFAVDDLATKTLVISAPVHSYTGAPAGAQVPKPDVRHSTLSAWGAFLPMYALHSGESWGAGNFSDWEKFSHWIGSLGGSVTSTLPLLAAFLDHPTCEPSPYSPASRLFWNEFYLDIPRIPEFARCSEAQALVQSPAFQKQLEHFRCAEDIDYAAQWKPRRQVLELLAKCFFAQSTDRRDRLEELRRQRPELDDYAAFRAVCDRRNAPWREWPARLRDGELRLEDYDEATKQFYLYSQWLAHEQINHLARSGEEQGVRLYLDLPLGVHPHGYDVWRERDSYASGVSAGAPPDMFFTRGQDWAFAPLHPERIRDLGYRHLLAFLRFQMRHARLLRVDHVMGLHRLYWIPHGFPARQGVYVNYPAEELHAIFNLESHRHRTVLIGENLGTVPPSVNRSMERHRLREMYVVQYEHRPDPEAALRPVPALSAASLNTHDMPPFAAFWNGDDLLDRVELGLFPHNELPEERQNRGKSKEAIMTFLAARGLLKDGQRDVRDVLLALLAWLGKSESELVLVTMEDLWLETRPQNVPGTSTERPNWRHQARLSLEQMQSDAEVLEALKVMGGKGTASSDAT